MIVPKKLKIGGIPIAIKFRDALDNPNGFGCFEASKNLISLRAGNPPNQIEVTLLHEIIHALNCNIPELEVEYLAQGIYQVIIDNNLIFTGK